MAWPWKRSCGAAVLAIAIAIASHPACSEAIPRQATVDYFQASCEIGDGFCEAFVMSVFKTMVRASALGIHACPGLQAVPTKEIPRCLANAAMIEARAASGPLQFYSAKLMVAQVVATRFPCLGDD